MYTLPFMASSLSTRSASSMRRPSVSITMFLLIFLIPKRPSSQHHLEGGWSESRTGGIGISLANAAAPDDDEAERALRALFVDDIKQLLTHNQRFYNEYGRKDDKVDLAFEQARIAAHVIFLYPEIFKGRIRDINQRITEALAKKDMDMEGATGVTADGVTVFFVDKGVLLLGVMGGFVRFPE